MPKTTKEALKVKRTKRETVVREVEEEAVGVNSGNLVSYGVHQMRLPLAGKTVSAARSLVRAPFNIEDQAVVHVNGQEVGLNHVIGKTDTIEFVKFSGSKG